MSSLRFMTFNIRGATYRDGPNAWKKRACLNLDAIRSNAPDIIGFQELQTGNMAVYQDGLGEYDCYPGSPYNRPGRLFFCSIYWHREHLKCLDSGSFYLSTTPQHWSLDWQAARVHVCTWSIFKIKITGEILLFANTHLDHISPEARAESAALICNRLLLYGTGCPTVLVGDLNAEPDEDPCKILSQAGYEDAAKSAANELDKVATSHGFQGEKSANARRLDRILIKPNSRPLTVNSYAVDRYAAPPLYPSDHYPVLTDVTLD